MAEKHWFWATLTLSSITIASLVFGAWEVVENHFFRYTSYVTLHYLYITRGVATALLLAFWAAWYVLRQRRKAEEELEKSREHYRRLMEAFPGAVVLYDADLNVLEWNASAERLYGYSKIEVSGWPLLIVPASKRAELRDLIQRVQKGEAVLDLETLRAPISGEPIEVQLSLLPFRDVANTLHFLEVTSDIRDRVRWRQRMLEIEKLTSMGKMAAGTAHHLNSPLAALLLRVQMMREHGGDSSFGSDIERLEEGLQFCRHFVQRLLEFTRARPPEKQDQELSKIIESAGAFFNPAIQSKRARLTIDTSQTNGQKVYADRNLMEAVLLILLSNALDAVSSGGQIQLRTKAVGPGRIAFQVSDDGSGISAENLPHIFEPFFTTKESGKGTGLGLAIAKNIILEHGGTMTIDSVPGFGASANVELPLAQQAMPTGAA
jgi:PAS domain S-box-containing protein